MRTNTQSAVVCELHHRDVRKGGVPWRAIRLVKGVLDLAVLAVVAREDGYGYDVVRRLRSAGLDEVGDASVYGTLRRLYSAGALTSYVASDEGPHRKYYGINAQGRHLLETEGKTLAAFAATMDGLLEQAGSANRERHGSHGGTTERGLRRSNSGAARRCRVGAGSRGRRARVRHRVRNPASTCPAMRSRISLPVWRRTWTSALPRLASGSGCCSGSPRPTPPSCGGRPRPPGARRRRWRHRSGSRRDHGDVAWRQGRRHPRSLAAAARASARRGGSRAVPPWAGCCPCGQAPAVRFCCRCSAQSSPSGWA